MAIALSCGQGLSHTLGMLITIVHMSNVAYTTVTREGLSLGVHEVTTYMYACLRRQRLSETEFLRACKVVHLAQCTSAGDAHMNTT